MSTELAPIDRAQRANAGGRARWIALVVLCAGMLMIVLDATVVNVALPSIQDDLGFSQSSLAWVVNAYLIAFGGLLLLAGRLGDLIGRRGVFLTGLLVFTVASLLCGLAQSEAMLVARPLRPGRRRRDDLRRDPRDDRDDVPGAAGAGEGDRRLQLRRLGRRLDRPARRRRADPGDQLALDLLHQHPDRDRHRAPRLRLLDRDKGIGFGEGADVLGAMLITAALMLGVYTIVEPAANDGWGATQTLGVRRRRRWCCSPPSSSARRPPRTRWCRCGSSAPATSPAPTRSRR